MPHYHEKRRSSSVDAEPKQGVASGDSLVLSRLQSVDEKEQLKTDDTVDAEETSMPLIGLQEKGQSTESQLNRPRSEKGEVCPFLVSPLLCFCLFVCLFVCCCCFLYLVNRN